MNYLGHIILDQLMIAVLNAPASCLPGMVEFHFENTSALQRKMCTSVGDGTLTLSAFARSWRRELGHTLPMGAHVMSHISPDNLPWYNNDLWA